jgi:hypothetical protein
MPSLNRTRPYGTIFPPLDGASFEQDHMHFNQAGEFLRLAPGHPDAGKKPAAGRPAAPPKPAKNALPAPPAEEPGKADNGGAELVAVADLGWNDLRRLSAKLGGPKGVGVKRDDVLAFLADDGTAHVAKASLAE